MEFYPRWKTFGETAFNIIDLEFETKTEADDFLSKLALIDNYAGDIARRKASVEESRREQKEAQTSKRRNAPKKVGK